MSERKVGTKAAFGLAHNEEPLIIFEDFVNKYFAISVNASTDHEIQEKIRHSNKRNKHVERLPDWRNGIAKMLKYLAENPFEQIYDPADDEL